VTLVKVIQSLTIIIIITCDIVTTLSFVADLTFGGNLFIIKMNDSAARRGTIDDITNGF
jgi:hypothetical protein